MRTYLKFLASFALLVLFQTQAAAWSGPGHAAVAALAYRGLSATERVHFTDLLRSHPNFAEWEEDFTRLRSQGLSQDVDLGMYLFIRASTWPDEIRRTGNVFDHPNWHFADYPLQSPSFTTGPRPAPEDDVLFGIQQSLSVLKDPEAFPVSRAAHLSWLIHLVGDLHQPLHCATLFSSQFRPPEGDRGGNLFLVSQTGTSGSTNLHSFWDGQLGRGNRPDPEDALENATSLETEHPRSTLAELTGATTAEAWSLESRDTAIRRAYQFEETDSDGNVHLQKLRGGTNERRAPVLPQGYAETARTVARQRLALAGYRLHDQLLLVKFADAEEPGGGSGG